MIKVYGFFAEIELLSTPSCSDPRAIMVFSLRGRERGLWFGQDSQENPVTKEKTQASSSK